MFRRIHHAGVALASLASSTYESFPSTFCCSIPYRERRMYRQCVMFVVKLHLQFLVVAQLILQLKKAS